MSFKEWLTALGAMFAVGFCFGYYAMPQKTVIQRQIIEVEKKTQDVQKDTVRTETRKPDGTVEIRTERHVDQHTQTDTNKQETERQEIVKSSGVLSVSAMAGTTFSLTPPVYGAMVSRNLIGPITVGLWGISNGTGGVAVGLNF